MILELNENNFKEEILKHPKVLVFFYREKGCSFCTKMKPIVKEYAETNVVGYYSLGNSPDSVTEGVVERFPTFVAYVNGLAVGKQEGSMSLEQLDLTFTPEKIVRAAPQQAPLEISKAPLIQLLTDEANLIDQIGPMRSHLAKIQAEIKRRQKLAMGKVDCCDSCADGGSCGDDH